MGKQLMTLTTPIMCKTTRENKTVKARIHRSRRTVHEFHLRKKTQLPFLSPETTNNPEKCGWHSEFPRKNHTLHLDLTSRRIHLATWTTLVTRIGTDDIIFGLPWFQKYQPIVNWTSGKITIDKEPCQLQIKYWKTDQIRRAKIKDAPTTTINAMESQEEYDKEVQELYDQIQQQMDQEINKAKKRRQERQTPKIVE